MSRREFLLVQLRAAWASASAVAAEAHAIHRLLSRGWISDELAATWALQAGIIEALRNGGMSAHHPPPPAVDLLQQAVDHVRGHLDRSLPVSERLPTLWAGVAAARDLGATDVVAEAFLELAHESGLAADLGRHADDDIHAVIRAAMLDQNPFD
jgi:hypothetical protein